MGVVSWLVLRGWGIRLRREVRHYWWGHLQVAEVGRVGDIVVACTDADEFDFRHDEAVAAGVLAHAALEVREAVEVFDALVWWFLAHAAVPAVEALDEADEAAALVAGGCEFGICGIVGDEMGPAVGAVSCEKGLRCWFEDQPLADGGLDSGVYAGSVDVAD